jgi:hypothetical protein
MPNRPKFQRQKLTSMLKYFKNKLINVKFDTKLKLKFIILKKEEPAKADAPKKKSTLFSDDDSDNDWFS